MTFFSQSLECFTSYGLNVYADLVTVVVGFFVVCFALTYISF